MADKQDVTDALRASVQRAEEIAAGLSEADQARQVYIGWTVKDVFAHLASMGGSPAYFIVMAQREEPSTGSGSGGGFDINAFNKMQIESRRDKPLPELVAEFRQGHEASIVMIDTTPDEVLFKKAVNPFRGGIMSTTLEMIQGSVADHESEHLDDIVAALRG